MSTSKFQRIAIVGVGLLGGSLGMAIRKRGLAAEVVGIGRNPVRLATAKRLKAITSSTTFLKEGISGCELAIVCTPVQSIADKVHQITEVADGPILITDVGSTKTASVKELDRLQESRAWPNDARFVGSHPIAGNEKSGVEHGSAELFVGRAVVVTPSANTKPSDTKAIQAFWTALDAKVMLLSPAEHDVAMAAVSHLPHLLASAIAASTPERYLELCGTGWQDTTRIAAGDPQLWQGILQSNRENLLASLAEFERVLANFSNALKWNDPLELERLLALGKKRRDEPKGSRRKKTK
jgi:prephenate dehydrogenase